MGVSGGRFWRERSVAAQLQPQARRDGTGALKKTRLGADTPGMNTLITFSQWVARRVQAAGAAGALLFLWGVGTAHAEWTPLEKTEQLTYFFDKDSVKAAHVTRYAWTLTELADAMNNAGIPGAVAQPKVKSTLTRWRVHCITDMVARLSISFYDQPQGKGAPLSSQDETEWRVRETPIRPGSVQALLKKEVCQ